MEISRGKGEVFGGNARIDRKNFDLEIFVEIDLIMGRAPLFSDLKKTKCSESTAWHGAKRGEFKKYFSFLLITIGFPQSL